MINTISLLDIILKNVLFVLVEIIAPQRYRRWTRHSRTRSLLFLIQLFKTKRL